MISEREPRGWRERGFAERRTRYFYLVSWEERKQADVSPVKGRCRCTTVDLGWRAGRRRRRAW